MSEKRLGLRRSPEARGESEDRTSMQQSLDSLTPQEEELVFARIESLNPRDPDFERDRDTIVRQALREIELQRTHSQGERI